MSSRVAASVAHATGLGKQMVVYSREEYEDRAVALANSLKQPIRNTADQVWHEDVHPDVDPLCGEGELLELRRRLFLGRKTMPLFDTLRWTRNLEKGYVAAWRRWVEGKQFRSKPGEDGSIQVHDDEELGLLP